jgi:uncharacterized membrane protein YphA (DoxX/SURF4 family)
MDTRRSATASILLGRLLVGGLYLSAGVNNLLALDGRIAYAAAKGVPLVGLAAPVANLLLLVGGFCLLAGFRPRLGVLAIVCFLGPVTFFMHDFWNQEGLQRVAETARFMANVGLLGSALIFLAVPRPWAFGLDDWPALGDALRGLVHRPIRRPTAANSPTQG